MISMITAESELWHNDFFLKGKVCCGKEKKKKEVGDNKDF